MEKVFSSLILHVVNSDADQGAERPAGPQHSEKEDHPSVSLLSSSRQFGRGALHSRQVVVSPFSPADSSAIS